MVDVTINITFSISGIPQMIIRPEMQKESVFNQNNQKIAAFILTIWNLDCSCILQSECAWMWLGDSFWEPETGGGIFISMMPLWCTIISRQIGKPWLRRGLVAEGTSRWCGYWIVL